MNQIIDDAYKNYRLKSNDIDLPENLYNNLIDDLNKDAMFPIDNPSRMLSKEKFINKIKTDSEFSKKWGLKIEERELSLGDRGELFRKEHPNKSVNDFAPNGMEVQSLNHQLNTRYNNANIPTKLITVTYNNETIESYE